MRTMITRQGEDYFWSVLPPIYSRPGLNFGKAPSFQQAEEAVKQYCNAAVTKAHDGILYETRKPCMLPRCHQVVL